jgi:hypothetical protein
MKRILSLASFALMVSLLAAGCGDSSPSAPSEPENLSANIAGTWSGQTMMFGSNVNVTVSISQAQSDPSMTAVVPLTGSVSINTTTLPATGTKQGNTWSMSGNSGATIVTIHQNLASASQSSGDLTLKIGANQGQVVLALVKS